MYFEVKMYHANYVTHLSWRLCSSLYSYTPGMGSDAEMRYILCTLHTTTRVKAYIKSTHAMSCRFRSGLEG
jgi:hypothetical protein